MARLRASGADPWLALTIVMVLARGAGRYVGRRPVVGPERIVPLHGDSFCLVRCSWYCWGDIDIASLCPPILAYTSVYYRVLTYINIY